MLLFVIERQEIIFIIRLFLFVKKDKLIWFRMFLSGWIENDRGKFSTDIPRRNSYFWRRLILATDLFPHSRSFLWADTSTSKSSCVVIWVFDPDMFWNLRWVVASWRESSVYSWFFDLTSRLMRKNFFRWFWFLTLLLMISKPSKECNVDVDLRGSYLITHYSWGRLLVIELLEKKKNWKTRKVWALKRMKLERENLFHS